MSLSEVKFPKYNIYMKYLFNLILSLNPEEQRFLLKKIDKLDLKERRAYSRKVCRLPVKYFYKERIFDNFILNISLGGCFIETQKPLPVGEKFLMDFKLDDDAKSIRIIGVVTNANRMGMGVKFEIVNSSLLGNLGNLLNKS
jgi:Tfp pilus assembly protein PilZ